MSALQAVIFDLDDTLLLDEELTRGAFSEAARTAAASRPALNAVDFARSAHAASEQLFASHPSFPAWNALGIAASELLWADFADSTLSAWAGKFRCRSFATALAELGFGGDGKPEAEAFARARLSGERLVPGAREVLEILSAEFRLGLLTNGDPRVQRGKLERSGLESFFRAVVVSGEEGVGKPQCEIFHRMLRRLEVSAEQAAMVGNSLRRDIAGARAAGLAAAIWLQIPGAEEFDNVTPTHTIGRLLDLPGALGMRGAARPAASP